MANQNYTREEVVKIIETLLEFPDQLIDATMNENTDWDAESLLGLVEEEIDK